jgi:hypothetical protein
MDHMAFDHLNSFTTRLLLHKGGIRIDYDYRKALPRIAGVKDQELAMQLVVTKLKVSVTEKTAVETTSTVETKVKHQPGSTP